MSEVRAATTSDAEAIARLAARTFALACPAHTAQTAIETHIRTELSTERFREHMAHAQFLVVDAPGGEVRGYVMLVSGPPPIEADWLHPLELRRIYVDEADMGAGTAAALMAESLRIAQRDGHDWVWLGTNEENARALRFYQKSGFSIVGRRTFRVADSEESDYVLARPVG